MRFIGLLATSVLIANVFAADAPAPAQVDKALRGRVKVFYQAHVDNRPRLADAVVAEDSKDIFFALPKPHYFSFEISGIRYSDKFTKAQVTVNCEQEMVIMPAAGRERLKVPQLTYWKLVKGQWFWYVDKTMTRDTPFGPVKVNPGGVTSAQPPAANGPSIADVTNQVKADKDEVRIGTSEPSSQVVTVKNGMPGWITLTLERPRIDLPGFDVAFDRTSVPLGGDAKLTIKYEPKGPLAQKQVLVNVVVQPTDQIIPIRIVFTDGPAK